MARKRTEVNPIRGERLRSLLKKHNMEQQELADKIGYTKEHISYIVNGKRNLTQEAAESIVKLFPGIRVGWLLGYDDFETDFDALYEKGSEFLDTENAIIEIMRFAAKLLGYQLEWADAACNEGDEITLANKDDSNEVIFNLVKGSTKFEITDEEDIEFMNELTRYAMFLIEGLIHHKNDTWHPFALTKEMLGND